MTKMIESVNAVAFDATAGLHELMSVHPGSQFIEDFDEVACQALKGVTGLAILRVESLVGGGDDASGFKPVGWAPSIEHACSTCWAVESGELRVSGKKLSAEQYIRWYRDVVERPKAVSKAHVTQCPFGVPYERLEAMPMAVWLLIANSISAGVLTVEKTHREHPRGLIVPRIGPDGISIDAAMVAILLMCSCGPDAGMGHMSVINSKLVEELILAAEVGAQCAFQF